MKLKKSSVLLIYLTAFMFTAVLDNIFDTIQYQTLLNVVFLAVSVCLLALFGVRIKKLWQAGVYEAPRSGYKDKIKKRISNLTYTLIYISAIFIVNLFMAVVSTSGKFHEVLSAVRPSVSWLLIALFLQVAAVLLLRAICSEDERKAYRKYYLHQALIFGSAWLIYLISGAFVGLRFIYMSFGYASAIYLALVLICSFTLRKSIVEVNFRWKKRYTLAIVSVLAVVLSVTYMRRETYYLQGYINKLPRLSQNTVPISYRDADGVFELYMQNDEFRILQLTDIHLGGSLTSIRKDKMALEAVYREIEYTKPDLVIVTGDMTFPLGIMSMSLNNGSSVSQFAAFMRNLNIPWAFTFGNHDTEVMASLTADGLCELYRSLSFKTSGTLLYPYVQPDITGRNNQLIELYNSDGSLNTALFLIDSNAYTGRSINDYDYIHDDQVDWYESEVKRMRESEGRDIPSMAFFHIPLQEYREAYELYMAGSDEVAYFFGSNDEEMIDNVCCSDYPSRIFGKMTELGSTKALFCGHDHYNNMSLEYRGIRLTYGMSIDYLVMPGIDKSNKQRGGTLITIYEDSTFDIRQIPLRDIT